VPADGDNEHFSGSDSVHTVSPNGQNERGAFVRTDTYVVTEPHRGNRTRLARELSVEGLPILRFIAPQCDHCKVQDVLDNSLEILVKRRTQFRVFRNGVELVVVPSDDIDDEPGAAASQGTPVATPTQTPSEASSQYLVREQQGLLEQLRGAVADQRRLFELGQLSLARQQDALVAANKQVEDARDRVKTVLKSHDDILDDDLKTTIALRQQTRASIKEDLAAHNANLKQFHEGTQGQLSFTAELQKTTLALQNLLVEHLQQKPTPFEDKLKIVRETADALLQSNLGEAGTQVAAVYLANLFATFGGRVSVAQVMDGFFVRGAEFRKRMVTLRTMLAMHLATDNGHAMSTAADYLEGAVGEDAVDLLLRRTVKVTQAR
jgi:hypothetical protein